MTAVMSNTLHNVYLQHDFGRLSYILLLVRIFQSDVEHFTVCLCHLVLLQIVGCDWNTAAWCV